MDNTITAKASKSLRIFLESEEGKEVAGALINSTPRLTRGAALPTDEKLISSGMIEGYRSAIDMIYFLAEPRKKDKAQLEEGLEQPAQ